MSQNKIENNAFSGNSRPFTVAVEGNIACGKTSMLNYLGKYGNLTVLSEPVEKWRALAPSSSLGSGVREGQSYNLLDYMYKDRERWGFTFQSYVQLTMLENHLAPVETPIKLMERSIHSARYCFIENLYRSGGMTDMEYTVLSEWFDYLTSSPGVQADLYVYLRAEPSTVIERIRKRNRSEELGVSLEFLEVLHRLHDDWLLHGICPSKLESRPIVKVIDVNSTNLSKIHGLYDDLLSEIIELSEQQFSENVPSSSVGKGNSPSKRHLLGDVVNLK